MEGLSVSDANLTVYVHPSRAKNVRQAIPRQLASSPPVPPFLPRAPAPCPLSVSPKSHLSVFGDLFPTPLFPATSLLPSVSGDLSPTPLFPGDVSTPLFPATAPDHGRARGDGGGSAVGGGRARVEEHDGDSDHARAASAACVAPGPGGPYAGVLYVWGGAWNYRRRGRDPMLHPCLKASQAEGQVEGGGDGEGEVLVKYYF